MIEVIVYSETSPAVVQRRIDGFNAVSRAMKDINVRLEDVTLAEKLQRGIDADIVNRAYAPVIKREQQQRRDESGQEYLVDVVGFNADSFTKMPAEVIAQKRYDFRDEHTHDEDEVRIMHEGAGLFYFRENTWVYALPLEAGQLVAIPKSLRHGFDMGANPDFRAVRFLGDPAGYKANSTGTNIFISFPEHIAA